MTAKQPEQRVANMQDVEAQLVLLNQASTPQSKPNVVSITSIFGLRSRWQHKSKQIRIALGFFGAVATIMLAIAIAWQFAPLGSSLPTVLTPYSQAQELKEGFAALRLSDRPGSLDAATKNFTTVLEHDVNNAAAVAGLSLIYSFRYFSDEQDEIWLQKADASAQQAILLNDQLAISHVARGTVLDLQGKSELGLLEIEQAFKLDPEDFFAWDAKATILRHLHRYDEAKNISEDGLRRFPRERIFADKLGAIYYAQGLYQQAENAFKQSIRLQPDAVYAYANLSAVLSIQNRDEEALKILQEGLQIRPSALLYGNLGNAQFQRADYVAAARSFELAVSRDKGNPQDYLGWANLGDTLLWIPGRKDDARQAYQKAIDLLSPRLAKRPNDVVLVSRMGLYAARSGRSQSARELAQKATQLAPQDPSVHFRAALGYELIGDRKAALIDIKKAKLSGYPEKFIEAEPDLLALRRDPEYSRP